MSSDEEQYDYLEDEKDEGVKKAINDAVLEIMVDQNIIDRNQDSQKQSFPKKDLTRQRLLNNLNFKGSMPKVDEQSEPEYQEAGPKRQRDYMVVEPPRFKILGHNSQRKPIFRMSDLYLINDIKVQNIIEEQFSRAIYGGRQLNYGFLSKFDNRSKLSEIISKWSNKEEEDFQQGRNNMMSEEEIEDAVVNLGDKKQDYFLYLNKQPQKMVYKNVKNIPLTHPNFKNNLYNAVNRLTQQYRNVIEQEQIDSEEQLIVQKNQDKGVKNQSEQQQKNQQKPIQRQIFGEIKDNNRKKIRKRKNQVLVEEWTEKNPEGALNEEIIRHFSQINSCIAMQDAHKKQIKDYNRIEIDLSNNHYFLDKLSTVLEKNIQNKKLKTLGEQHNVTDPNFSVNNPLINGSVISGSQPTGNKRSIKPHLLHNSQNFPQQGEDENQTIQQKISKQIKSQQKDVINHSEVAKNCLVVKFSVRHQDFFPFHRYSFPYAIHFNRKVKVHFVTHKPLKNRGSDLSLNSEYVYSWKKFNNVESLSLGSGEYKQFIAVQYIEQNPLLMSNVGMCQRMLLQVSDKEILEKVKQDIINQSTLQMIEQRRDNMIRSENQCSFEQKCKLWRKNIRQIFGENGKVYLWQNKREGKLIGSPDGPGVAIMESNLASVPIVRKQNKKTDFLLVREGDKWMIRKIDNLYVSGQVQPKKTVLNPDSRQFYAYFMGIYQKAFILRSISLNGKVRLDELRNLFVNSNQNSLKKVLKSLNAQANDNKTYTLNHEGRTKELELSPQDVCLYEKMQSSICQLEQVGIRRVRHNQKIRQILNIFFKRHLDSLEKFAISKFIKEQLQLTSWYLTDAFASFINGSAKIDLHGHADPTNNRGGYSYIKKPQKQRTEKEQLHQKQQKKKVSGTNADLRKLKTQNTASLLMERGYKADELKGKTRWQLVGFIRQEDGTEYARQERQTKLMRIENEKKEINKVFNKMLRILNEEQQTPAYNYNMKKQLSLNIYKERERPNWLRKKQLISYGQENDKSEEIQEEDDD